MLNLVEHIDFHDELNKEIKKLLVCINKDAALQITDQIFQLTIVGEEDGKFLFAWKCYLKSLSAQTFLALYDAEKQRSELVFTQEKQLNIMSATVNAQRTLVAFSIVELHDNEEIYKSYIAEIRPQNRVFSLNISWRTLQRVLFLREDDDCTQTPRVSHMLFFHHLESVGLYHIPVVEKDGRHLMSMQPSTEQICDPFLWSHFDSNEQRLFVVKMLPRDDNVLITKGGSKYTYLSCYPRQFVFVVMSHF